MKKILILRFSAMGDVALLLPVVRSFLYHYPEAEITLVTRPRFAAFFENIPRVSVFPAEVDQAYAGIAGLFRLFRKINKSGKYDLVLDLHDHTRTILLRNLFKVAGNRVVVFNKGRKEKKAILRGDKSKLNQLPHITARYQQAFAQAGLPFETGEGPWLIPSHEAQASVPSKQPADKTWWIGIAPFAMHKSKTWPLENYPALMQQIIAEHPVKFFLFGGGENQISYFESLQKQFPQHTEIVAGRYALPLEFALMKRLDLMLCVDSSNMHMASLIGTPVLSIWGGTHPAMGYSPFGAGDNSIIQVPETQLTCRPCSAFGKDTCQRGDFACLTGITPEVVMNRIKDKIKIGD